MVLLLTALSQVGHNLIATERARIVSQASVLAAIYGGEPASREIAGLNSATPCGFRAPSAQHQNFAVCVDVEGSQSHAHAFDTWANSVSTLEP